MDNFLRAVQDWPVLVQGAIGSGLFWLILLIGQRLTGYFSGQLGAWSTRRRRAKIDTELLRVKAFVSAEDEGGHYAALLWYRASRDLIRGLIWLTLGLIFDTFLGVFGVVGFIGCIYYLFGALEVVKPMRFTGDTDQKIAELEEQRAELEKPNFVLQRTAASDCR